MKSKINILFLFFCFCCVFISAVAQTVTTLAGSTQGFADGAGTSAQFNGPWGIAVTNDGSLIVADRANNCIRKVTPDGVVTTLAGSTSFGLADGMGAAAKFRLPASVALDANGFIYVADQFNHCIRKITPDGMVTTLAGSGVSGFVNGTGTQAQFSTPSGIAVGNDGSVFVADTANECIRKISSSGLVTTYADSGVGGYMDGTAATAQFGAPRGIAIAPDGTIFVGELSNRIRKISPLGIVSTFAGSGIAGVADGVGTAAMFYLPYDIDIAPDGTLLVAAYGNHRIRKIAVDATVTTLAGSGVEGFADGPVTTAQFYGPSGVALAPDGTLYIVDSLNNRIRKIDGALSTTTFELKSQVTLFPNPSDGLFEVKFSSTASSEDVLYSVYDVLGKKFFEKKVLVINNGFEINLVDYPAGVYFLRITVGNSIINKKLIKK